MGYLMVKGNKFYKSRDHVVLEVKGVGDKVYDCLISITDVEKVLTYHGTWRAIEYPNGWVYVGTRALVNGKHNTLLLHRYLTDCPEDMVVDHWNKNTIDNRRENMRVCTQAENMQNSTLVGKKGAKNPYIGVSWENVDGGKWRVRRSKKGIRYDKGFFRDLNEAIQVAKDLDKELKEMR